MPLRLTLLALLVLAVAPDVQAADRAEAAYREAQKDFWELKASAEKQKFRHHWRHAAEQFVSVATHFPKSGRAPAALYTAGQLFTDLSAISRLSGDVDDAVKAYQRLVDVYPKDRLADDGALALARLLLEHKGDKERARDVLLRILKAQADGDMAGRLRALLDTLPGPRPVEPPAVARAPRREPKPEPVKPEPVKPEPKVAQRPERREEAPREARAGSRAAEERATVRAGADTQAPAPKQSAASDEDEEASASTSEEEAAVAERSAAGRPGASAVVPRAKSASTSAKLAETVQRQARRVVSATPVPGARPVATGEAEDGEADAGEEAAPGPVRAPTQVELAQGPLVDAYARVEQERAAAAAEGRPAQRGFQGPGRGLVDAVARFAREDVPRAFEDPATTRAREEAARRRLLAAAEANRRAELTLAEQLGLKVRRVVIDAGHGGHDTGAIGKKGTREKDVSLAIAQRLAELLEEKGLEVILTRDDDRFVKLEDRSRIANAARGDLFISIHCNSAVNRKAHGVETYTLNVASDRYSIRLAARENAASQKGMSDLRFILADLATKANTEESSRLARSVQASLVGDLSRKYRDIRDLGHKEALFFVLLGARMPAILVETAFLSNPEEEARLASRGYQQDVAQAIAAGVDAFLGNRARVAQVR